MATGRLSSLLKANRKAMVYTFQVPCLLPIDLNIRAVNLLGIDWTHLKLPKDVEIMWSGQQKNKIINSNLVTIITFLGYMVLIQFLKPN